MSNADTNSFEPYSAVADGQAAVVWAVEAVVEAVEPAGQFLIFFLYCPKSETRRFSTNKVAAAHIHNR